MVVREAGILYRGFTLISTSYHQTGEDLDQDLRSGLMTAIINFVENAFVNTKVDYLEGTKFVIAFKQDLIKSKDMNEREPFFAYVIIDNQKKIEKHIKKVINPLLEKVVDKFLSIYDGNYLSEISQFKRFKRQLDSIFGTDTTQTVDEKLKDVFY
ncbi:MAG: hypothetical protein GF317_00435 [Candidatus Lokiarchaeota archaeon]|nr:hypothetical protein [Candidatus Lokiarchaeota archaeon]MBD3198443.1 hypothetical protein [Candidatus Lokiarchaeota archaeon]